VLDPWNTLGCQKQGLVHYFPEKNVVSENESSVSGKEGLVSRKESSGNGLCPSPVVDTLGIGLPNVSKDRLLNAGDWLGESKLWVLCEGLLLVNYDSKCFAGGTHLLLGPPLKLYWAVQDAASGLWICLTLSLTTPRVELD
jgi:hypothetical protein